MITSSNANEVNGNVATVGCLAQIQLIENMKIRTTRIQTLIEEETDRIKRELRVNTKRTKWIQTLIEEETDRINKEPGMDTTRLDGVTETQVQRELHARAVESAEMLRSDPDYWFLYGKQVSSCSLFLDYLKQTDAFTIAVTKMVANQKSYTTDQLNAFMEIPPPLT